ncbi:MAG: AAA family ATPase [Clostridiales bacterium]|jgi:chromosome partitioning protein|nr:AAA family ATPase [Clostridiales bacterium]
MGRIIAIANQKGGVGKTTTNINLSTCLAQEGKRVLVADMDPQGNTTSGFGVDKKALSRTIYNLLLGDDGYIEQVVRPTMVEGLRLLPANINLSGAEIELVDQPKREYLLRAILNHMKYLYDYILIDCPPSLNLLTLNALCAADTVLVPIQCEFYAMEGLSQLMHTIGLVQRKLNPRLTIEGVVFTMFDARTNLSTQVVDEVKAHLSEYTYQTIIPRNVRLSEAPSHGLPITLYDDKSKGAEAYRLLAQEVIARGNK